MSNVNYRWERIERLLEEIRYEVTRGIMEGEIDEEIRFRFVIPISRKINGGVVTAEFRTRPRPGAYRFDFGLDKPRLRVVEGTKGD